MTDLIELFEKSNQEFLDSEKYLILSGVSERTLCGSLMKFIDKNIKNTKYKDYYVDVEYNRNNGKIKTIVDNDYKIITITCDLIIHSRGENRIQDNLIAIEMKKSDVKTDDKLSDKHRLMALTKDSFDDTWSFDGKTLPEHVCRYMLGIYYEINIARHTINIEYYQKGKCIQHYNQTF